MPRVLMLSLSADVLDPTIEGVQARHLAYAERIGQLHMLAYAPRREGTVELSPALTVTTVGRGGRWGFVAEAVRLGMRFGPFDLVTAQDPFATGLAAWVLARRLGAKLHAQNHSDFFDNPHWLRERRVRNAAFNALGKFIVRRADGLRVVNDSEKQKYVGMGIPAGRVQVVPVPVELGRFLTPPPPGRVASLRAELGLPAESKVILWAGNPTPVKDVPTLLAAFARTRKREPKVALVLAGGVARGEADGVYYAGRVPYERLPLFFHLCEAYAHASRYEGFGRVMVEAGAAGKPVASTDTAGAREIVQPGVTGLLSPVGDAASLSQNLLALLDDLPGAQRMGDAARSFVKNKFDPERLTAGVIESWQACLR